MSVIEFFTNYWDWYLLIGFVIRVGAAITLKNIKGWLDFLSLPIEVITWPFGVAALLCKYLNRV
jgi:hypothetical protein